MSVPLIANLKHFVKNNVFFLNLYCIVNNYMPFNNHLHFGKGVSVESNVLLKHCRVNDYGKNNKIIIKKGSSLTNCTFLIYGNNNQIIISDYVRADELSIHIEDENNKIFIGNKTTFERGVRLSCIEGTYIQIGEDCMFSSNITLTTGDSHSILDLEGNRINPSKSIIIGNHIWVGNSVKMTKGVSLCDNSIIGMGSIVTRKFNQANVAIAGNPANVIKNNISWDRQRIAVKDEIV